jgi:hypothetical protein
MIENLKRSKMTNKKKHMIKNLSRENSYSYNQIKIKISPFPRIYIIINCFPQVSNLSLSPLRYTRGTYFD